MNGGAPDAIPPGDFHGEADGAYTLYTEALSYAPFLYQTSRSQKRTTAAPRIRPFGACYGRGVNKHDPERRTGDGRRDGRQNLAPSNR